MRGFLKFIDQRNTSIIALLLVDIGSFSISFFSAYFVRNNFFAESIQPLPVYLKAFPIILGIMVFCFYITGLYEKQKRVTPLHELNLLIKATSLTAVLIMAYSFMRKYDYSRLFVITLWVLSLIVIKCGRLIVRAVKIHYYKKNIGLNRILIIGTGQTTNTLIQKLKRFEVFGYKVVGVLADTEPKNTVNYKFLGSTKLLLKVIKQKKVQEVFIADSTMKHEEILNLIQQCEDLNVRFKIVSDIFEIIVGDIDLNDIEGIPSLDLRKEKKTPLYNGIKRIMDIAFAMIGLILFSPFWLIITLVIRITYKCPALFVHKRVGLHGKQFDFYKFRSMFQTAPENEYSPSNANDPRITRFGKFLRRFSIDEIPQLINILKGDMSLVGPRPEMPFIVEKYSDWQRRRLDVKPGLTGLWQILGRKDLPLHENIEYDFYYIKNRSLLLDIIIILKTIGVVISGKGAY